MSTLALQTESTDSTTPACRLAGPAVMVGLLGGLLMIPMMTTSVGAAGMGDASPTNLGMPMFAYTITPVGHTCEPDDGHGHLAASLGDGSTRIRHPGRPHQRADG
jgi:hypothetical protein